MCCLQFIFKEFTQKTCVCVHVFGASLMASAVQEMHILSLGWEDPWGRKWQPTPVFLPEKIPRTEEPGGLQSIGSQKSQTQLSHWARTCKCVYRERSKNRTHTQQMCQNIYHWWIELESIVYGCSFYYPFFYKFELFQIKKLGKNRH